MNAHDHCDADLLAVPITSTRKLGGIVTLVRRCGRMLARPWLRRQSQVNAKVMESLDQLQDSAWKQDTQTDIAQMRQAFEQLQQRVTQLSGELAEANKHNTRLRTRITRLELELARIAQAPVEPGIPIAHLSRHDAH